MEFTEGDSWISPSHHLLWAWHRRLSEVHGKLLQIIAGHLNPSPVIESYHRSSKLIACQCKLLQVIASHHKSRQITQPSEAMPKHQLMGSNNRLFPDRFSEGIDDI